MLRVETPRTICIEMWFHMPASRAFDVVSSRPQITPRAQDPASGLTGLPAKQWDTLEPSARANLIKRLDTRYKIYLKRFYDTANICVGRHDLFIRRHRKWRYTAIVGTGTLACLNFAAAKQSFVHYTNYALPIVASIGALVLAILANLETFSNSAEQAHAYRESRELYLDAAQEFDRAWSVTVINLGDTAEAYANAVELYKRIVSADRDLRRSFKDVSKNGGRS
jgi:hypothetical protein